MIAGQQRNPEVQVRESPTGITLFYEDNGKGIPADQKEKIFLKRHYGTTKGLALFLLREILSITGITITESGEPGKGMRFEIHIPKGAFRHPSASHDDTS
ncbi:MAG: ATP-binding protein [Methanoregula sp.]|nr:ATP-binding protein [Methanoregula sp.]